jgi:seryl-tRNA synthetase
MLDINYIKNNPEVVKDGARNKNLNPNIVDEVLRYDQQRRELLGKVEKIRAEKNEVDRKLKSERTDDLIAQSKQFKEDLKDIEPDLKKVMDAYEELMLQVPNPPAHDVPVGKDESGNVVVKTHGEKRQFDFKPKEHFELAEALNLYDTKRAVRIAGTRAYFLKGELMLLERAILDYALEKMVKEGFMPMTVPWMVNKDAMTGTGYFPWGEEDHYRTQDGQSLIGTSEVSLTSYHKDELLNHKDLPIKLCGISPCYRREVGSYGKDTKGFFRLHQFTKVEMVVLMPADEEETRAMHDKMLGYAESLLQELGLPYQVLLMCTGDMGAGQRRKYDVETWFPGQNKYRETHSDSYFNDFQSRRLNMRYQDKDGTTKFVYTLNNTVAATPRLLAAILENYQEADGSITIPEVLRSRMPFKKIDKKE